MSRIAVVLGFIIVFFSIFAPVAIGTQLALIGVAFILLGTFIELRRIAKGLGRPED